MTARPWIQSRHNGAVRRGGFTLVELLVVISIIALLISILLPSLRKAREQGKRVKCAAHLSSFGKGFFGYASEQNDYYCSGSFDPDVDNGRDGPVDQVGWVADLVNNTYAFPAEQLCPSNEAKVNQKLATGLSGSFPSSFSNGDDYSSWELIDDRIRRGYNTNYTQSWYMARTEMFDPPSGSNPRRLSDTVGPLRTARILRVSSSNVPLLGDGGLETADEYLGRLDLGKRTVKTMTDGPASPRFLPQDYSDFGPAHGYASTRAATGTARDRANILFADGHVSVFIDKIVNGERDGQFAIRYDEARDEYVQDDVDAQVFDGVLSLGRRSRHHNIRR
jgi:prepilin-type N-terminal cleavage/methylation domain-containing protein/prepilin-type processing-associated H-X9-DG protein